MSRSLVRRFVVDNCVIKSAMKKILLIGCLILITACQSVTPTPAPVLPSPTKAPHTPTAPVSATPDFTSTPAFSPTPPPGFFTEEFDSHPVQWSTHLASGETIPQMDTENGSLVIFLDHPNNWVYTVYSPYDYTDIRLDAQVRGDGGKPGSIGLICRYSESAGWYEFNLSSDGTYGVLFGQWVAQGIARYTPIALDSSEYLQPGVLDYEIGLACQEDTLWLYINGKLFRKLDVSRYGLREGKVGITAASFDALPLTASFDWVKVSGP